ncbi:hypothetical protein [Sphingomonas sp. RS2018]
MRGAILVMTILLAGCGSTVPSGNTTAAVTPSEPSEFQTQVVALPEAQRNAVLIRAIRDADRDCQGVTKSERKPDVQGAPMYLATCQGGATFGVTFRRDGTAQVAGA